MVSLIDINEFIQVVAEAVADALEIETSVVDENLVRIAGTVAEKVPIVISTGVIKTVMETGKYHITHNTKTNAHCVTCSMRDQCKETAFVHCPIFYKGRIVGVMGLMCMDDEQRQRLVSKPDAMLNFVQHMCSMISLKLEEYESFQKEQELHKRIEAHSNLVDQILNSISDGYVIVDNRNQITRANRSAMSILGLTEGYRRSELLEQLLAEFDRDKKNARHNGRFSYYEEIIIGQKNYGITISLLSSDGEPIGKILNFKTLDKIGSRAIRKATGSAAPQQILGDSPAMVQMKELVMKSAGNDLSVLLCGESGTGKEMVAHFIHSHSARKDKPFIALNCAAIPESLLESELFGYEQGAFTGAGKNGKPGKFELAHTGTLFLDEIGDMPLFLQAKLLRVLQDFSIERVGSTKPRQVDVRIISATNQNLEAMLENGGFRRDLFYRINVIPIHLPPLRERGDDFLLLTDYFLQKYASLAKTAPKRLSSDVVEILRDHPWPGNVRELENLIQYLSFIVTDDVIEADVLPEKFLAGYLGKKPSRVPDQPQPVRSLADMERDAILTALAFYGNSTEGKRKAAEALGIGKTTLYRKLAGFGGEGRPMRKASPSWKC